MNRATDTKPAALIILAAILFFIVAKISFCVGFLAEKRLRSTTDFDICSFQKREDTLEEHALKVLIDK